MELTLSKGLLVGVTVTVVLLVHPVFFFKYFPPPPPHLACGSALVTGTRERPVTKSFRPVSFAIRFPVVFRDLYRHQAAPGTV